MFLLTPIILGGVPPAYVPIKVDDVTGLGSTQIEGSINASSVIQATHVVNGGTDLFVLGEYPAPTLKQFKITTPYVLPANPSVFATLAMPSSTVCTDLCFSSDGMKLYVMGWYSSTNQTIFQWDLSSAYSLAGRTSSNYNKTFAVPVTAWSLNTVRRLCISDDGTKFYMANDKSPNGTDDDVVEMALSTAHEIDTATLVGAYEVPNSNAHFYVCELIKVVGQGNQLITSYGGLVFSCSLQNGALSTISYLEQSSTAMAFGSDGGRGIGLADDNNHLYSSLHSSSTSSYSVATYTLPT